MVSTEYEFDSTREGSDFAQKVHYVLEGRWETETEFDDADNLREKVADFYNEFTDVVSLTADMDPREIKNSFEVYLEEDGVYNLSSFSRAVDKHLDQITDSANKDSAGV